MEDFSNYYPLLFTIANRMLHGAADAEDLVQESYLRYASTEQEISSLKSYLTTIITRLCLDYRKSARIQREQALDLLIGALPSADGARDDVRRVVIGILDELGVEHPLARESRRRLASALYEVCFL